MATITRLPDEVFLLILENESISIEDLMSFKSTCIRFRFITQNNKLWEKKFYQRCPLAKIKYNTKKRNLNLDFEKGITAGMKCIKSLQYYVSLMSHYDLRDANKKDLECLLRRTVEDSMLYYFVWDELNKIISGQLLWQLDSNLTTKYYFGIILERLKQYRIKYKRDKFINMPMEKQLFEHLFTIMVQYFQPCVSYSVIKTWLDDITEEVLSRLKNKHPAHSIFSTSFKQIYFWRDNNIDDNFWNPTEATQIMRILEEFIFSDLEDHKLHQLLITLHLNKIFNLHKKNNKIHYLHKNLISGCLRIYVLTTIYHSVARRLGIRCLLLLKIGKRHIKILWKPKYKNTKDVENLDFFYCKNNKPHTFYPLNIVRGSYTSRVPCKVLNNTWVINLMIQNFSKLLSSLVYIGDNIYYLWESKILEKIFNGNKINIMKPIEVKSDNLKNRLSQRRVQEIKFAVGLIVSHLSRISGTTVGMCHDGVIIAWLHSYDFHQAKAIGERDWKFMFPHLVTPDGFPLYSSNFYCCGPSNRFNKPRYMILAENNRVCLVPEDDISICPPKLINNVEIGRFFCKFEGTHYVPNEGLREAYPNDTAVIPKILSNQ